MQSGDELISPELLKARQLQKDEEDDIRRKTLKQRNSGKSGLLTDP
jgi:hypothetical protein